MKRCVKGILLCCLLCGVVSCSQGGNKKPAGTVPFEQVKEQITSYLKGTKQREAVQGVLKGLKDSATIETTLPPPPAGAAPGTAEPTNPAAAAPSN